MLFANDVNKLIDAGTTGPIEMPAEASGRIQTVLKRALTLLGTPYRWGGTSTERFRLQRPGRLRVPHRAGHRTAARLARDGQQRRERSSATT